MSTTDPYTLEVFLSCHSVELGLCIPSCDYGDVVKMGTFSVFICHVMPGSPLVRKHPP